MVIENVYQTIKSFKANHGLDWDLEDLAVTLHMMNEHRIDRHAALDQTCQGPNDQGIDGWELARAGGALSIYQSKLSADRKTVIAKGLPDIKRAVEFVQELILQGRHSRDNLNEKLHGLLAHLGKQGTAIKNIRFVLLSPLDPHDIMDTKDFEELQNWAGKTKLARYLRDLGGDIEIEVHGYNIKKSVPVYFKKYQVQKFEDTTIEIRSDAHLSISYIPLGDLVRLYRERGDVLFDKNVRLSLLPFKQSKQRVAHPMEETLDAICTGRLSPKIFPFYHVGVTIAAATEQKKSDKLFDLEAPSVLNGCQTISIANHFLSKLEDEKAIRKIRIFEEIPVLAKIVVGTNDDETREITNCNNRQNPIENWQLFSNFEIHVRIADNLSDVGIFYERQKGKFKTVWSSTGFAAEFPNTNGTYVDIPTLAMVLCLFQGRIQWAAKVSEVFTDKDRHSLVFNEALVRDRDQVVFAVNLSRAAKRGLDNYIFSTDKYKLDNFSAKLFKKPIVRAHLHHLAVLKMYQTIDVEADPKFRTRLNKSASPALVQESETIYRKIVGKTKSFFEKNGDARGEMSTQKREKFFRDLAVEIGVGKNTTIFQQSSSKKVI